jgi:HD-GYP domain-containing protein (c-di-GMP phosphodiesterase class II)
MERFKELLKNFSEISQIYFAIGDGKDFAQSIRPESNNGYFDESLKAFAAEVLHDDRFKAASMGQCDIYGIPVKAGDARAIALVAYKEKVSALAGRGESWKMRNFVTGLAGLIEDYYTTRRESEELADELSQGFETISLYSRITPQITSFAFSDSMFCALTEDLLETMRADLVFIRIPSRKEFNQLAENEHFSAQVADARIFSAHLINAIPSGAPSLKDRYFIVNDSRVDQIYRKLHQEPFRFLAAAIEHQSSSYGWLGVVSFNMKEIFRLSELRMLTTVAKQIAVTISNVDLYLELDRFVVNVVRSLVYAIEAKDTYTKGHSERVSQYCMRIADELHLSQQEKRTLFWSSILHDVGKIGISEKVLNKPGALTDEEFEEIKTHPEKGYRILKPLNQLKASLQDILHHHERYDGTGYPDGLKGDEISLQSRIIAVADTFDAITSYRSYRPPKSPEQALAIMDDVAGRQLDPDLVKVFKKVYGDDVVSGAEEVLFEEMR